MLSLASSPIPALEGFCLGHLSLDAYSREINPLMVPSDSFMRRWFDAFGSGSCASKSAG